MDLALSSRSWAVGTVRVGLPPARPAVRAVPPRACCMAGPNTSRTSGGHTLLFGQQAASPPCVRGTVVARSSAKEGSLGFQGVHHVAVIVSDLEASLGFYCGVLGLSINDDRPDNKLPYPGAWLWIGPEMIHLMELPNPDPLDGRPEHGGRDRHFCVGVKSVGAITEQLDAAGIPYTSSKSGRPAIFFRDPDSNCLECVEVAPWRSDIEQQ